MMDQRMRWFGPTWHAPLNEDCEPVATPVGEACIYCDKPIQQADRGVIMWSGETTGTGRLAWMQRPVHLRCLIRNTLGTEQGDALYEKLLEREAWIEDGTGYV